MESFYGNVIFGILAIAIGVLFFIAVIKDWDWFIKNSWPTAIWKWKRKAVRILFAIIGLVLIGLGIVLSVIKPQ